MGSVLFAGAHRDQQPRVAREDGAHRVGGENAQVQRQAHVVIAGCFAVLATAEWLRSDAAIWAALAGAAGLVALVLAVRPPGPRHTLSVAAAVASVLLGAVLGVGALRVWRVECCWPALRERRVTAASCFLQTSLGQAIAEARRLAERGATAASLPREAVFDRLDDAVESGPAFERGSAVLEARRQTLTATSVGSVLLSATPAIADGDQSLTATFARAHGVSLRLFPPGQGPRDSSVFEICTPRTPPPADCAPGDTLFSVQTIPPSQGDAKLAALADTAWLARLALVVLLAVLLLTAPAGAWRWGVVLVAGWTLLRSPFGPAALFSPATFYRPIAGVVGTS